MKIILLATALAFWGCACDSPKGCAAMLGVNNTPAGRQLVKDGRDDSSTQMAKLPPPPSEPVEKPAPVDINISNTTDPIVIDNGLNFNEIR